MKKYLFLLTIIFLAGCAPQSVKTASDAEEAQSVLLDFLHYLSTEEYDQAVSLYGGSYDQLLVFNPEIDPSDHLALWTWVCENQLLQCLEVHSVTLQNQESDTYVFQVEFNNPDGSLFVLGPCCGANETEMPPVSQFEFTVTKNAQGKFVVLNTPPYVP
jgi:hypothetical protein